MLKKGLAMQNELVVVVMVWRHSDIRFGAIWSLQPYISLEILIMLRYQLRYLGFKAISKN
jgi:hypothetical protein